MTKPPKRVTVFTGGQPVAGLPFQGELMTCVGCGAQQMSNPSEQSGWHAIYVAGEGVRKRADLCPRCFSQEAVVKVVRQMVEVA